MRVVRRDSFARAYQRSLYEVLYFPEYTTSPRDMKVKEVTNMALVVKEPWRALYHNKRRSSQIKYIAAEILWYFTGRCDLNFIEKYAGFWRQIANDDETLNSAYGNLIFKQKNEHGCTQWQWAMRSLIKDKDTRQAVMLFNKPQYQYGNNKDFICTLNGIFNIRNNKLNLTVNMRSNDAILGTPTDIAFFCLLLMQAHKLLKEYYPDLELGVYTHIANSYHIYERHFELVDQMLKDDFVRESYPDLDINLIDIDGNPHPELVHLTNIAEFGTEEEFKTSSKFLKWVYKQISK